MLGIHQYKYQEIWLKIPNNYYQHGWSCIVNAHMIIFEVAWSMRRSYYNIYLVLFALSDHLLAKPIIQIIHHNDSILCMIRLDQN